MVAETRPALAWSGPFRLVASCRPLVPETVSAVVEAYGKVEAAEEVAVKYEARTKLSNEPIPATESFQLGEVVPRPRLPALSILNLSVREPVVFLVSKAR